MKFDKSEYPDSVACHSLPAMDDELLEVTLKDITDNSLIVSC
jgi:hypothetical protein